MRFLLLVHSPRARWDEVPADGTDEEMLAHVALIAELDSQAKLVDCSPLAPPEEAVTVRVRARATQVTDSPQRRRWRRRRHACRLLRDRVPHH